MLLSISTTSQPATDLGYLLHKHPERYQRFPLAFGEAHVYYPEAGATRCTAALQVEVDPVRLVRRGANSGGFALAQYVNDRPYVASSFMSVAIGEVFGSALSGRSRERAELVDRQIPLEARISVVRCEDGDALIHRLFAPLGYDRIEVRRCPLDEQFPAWGQSSNYTVTLGTTARLQDMLRQLTVLLPVLDDDKHYWVGEDELDKLLRRGEGWLDTHPERATITDRYLRYRRTLIRDAIDRMTALDGSDPDGQTDTAISDEADERHLNLHEERLRAVTSALRESGARRVLDLGCGEGRLLERLLEHRQFTEIVGVDVSPAMLARAARRLRLDEPPAQGRVGLLPGALTYRDRRLTGFDAAAVVEVIEHLDPSRLAAFERVVFEVARPGTIVVTAPNREYNQAFAGLEADALRHPDHRFEWTRPEFERWAQAVADRHGYSVAVSGIGTSHPEWGHPSQMAVFTAGVTAALSG